MTTTPPPSPDAHAAAVKAAAEALSRHMDEDSLDPLGMDTCCAHAAVTAAAPHLLAPVEAEDNTVPEDWRRAYLDAMRERDEAIAEVARLRAALALQAESVEAAEAREREAVAAERRRIAAAILRLVDGRTGVAVQAWDEALRHAARIAEGETSTIRDVDPSNAQDAGPTQADYVSGYLRGMASDALGHAYTVTRADGDMARRAADLIVAQERRIAAALALHQPGVTGTDGQWCACGMHLYAECPTRRALTDAGDDATGTGEAS